MPHRYAVPAITALLAVLLLLTTSCGAYMKLSGEITRVRVVDTGGPRNVLVVEFQATNTAKIGYIFREAVIEITDDSGTAVGDAIAVHDARNLCKHMASLGGDCAEPILTRQAIGAGETVTRLVAAAFNRSAEDLRNRKSLTLRIIELDRLHTDFVEPAR